MALGNAVLPRRAAVAQLLPVRRGPEGGGDHDRLFEWHVWLQRFRHAGASGRVSGEGAGAALAVLDAFLRAWPHLGQLN